MIPEETRQWLIICSSLLPPLLFISSFIHHSSQNPPFPTLVHSLIHIDLMVNDWHRFEPLPISHVPIGLGGALIATCDTERRHRSGLDREPDVTFVRYVR